MAFQFQFEIGKPSFEINISKIVASFLFVILIAFSTNMKWLEIWWILPSAFFSHLLALAFDKLEFPHKAGPISDYFVVNKCLPGWYLFVLIYFVCKINYFCSFSNRINRRQWFIVSSLPKLREWESLISTIVIFYYHTSTDGLSRPHVQANIKSQRRLKTLPSTLLLLIIVLVL